MTRSLLAGSVAAVAVVPLLLLVAGGTATAGCAPATPPSAEPTGGSRGDPPGTWKPAQLRNAAAVVAQGKAQRAPARAWVIAVATAMQESSLYNLANPTVAGSLDYPHEGTGENYDSLGLFQQRESWGTVAERMTPSAAAHKFYTSLLRVPGWDRMALTDAAQAVQRSGLPTAYAKWERRATALVAWLVGGQERLEAAGGGGPWAPCGADALGSVPVGPAGWVAPLSAPITSGFGPREGGFHAGVDLGGARGDPVRAATAGKVIFAGCDPSTGNCDVDGSLATRGCGWYVVIRHSGGVSTRYCHLVQRPDVAVGDTVPAARVIGYVGTSGNSTGEHLHFEVIAAGEPVDPVRYLAARAVTLGTG